MLFVLGDEWFAHLVRVRIWLVVSVRAWGRQRDTCIVAAGPLSCGSRVLVFSRSRIPSPGTARDEGPSPITTIECGRGFVRRTGGAV